MASIDITSPVVNKGGVVPGALKEHLLQHEVEVVTLVLHLSTFFHSRLLLGERVTIGIDTPAPVQPS